MNIILSGGWGYGNLGDDALLEASLFIIRAKYPDSHIIVLSYDKEAIKFIEKFNDVTIKEDLYKILFGSAQHRFNKKKSSILINIKPVRRLVYLFKMLNLRFRVNAYMKNSNKFHEKYAKEINNISTLFENADLYIMSGGGYLNDWIECAIVKHQECNIAQSKGIKILMIGQTIGPFQRLAQTKLITSSICQIANKGFFRDSQSINEFKTTNFLSEPVPDLALYMNYESDSKFSKITLIGNFSFYNQCFFDDLQDYCIKNNYYIEILTTQLWESAMNGAINNYIILKNKQCPCTIVIPNSYEELNNILKSSSITISQNLHGLILSYRAGAKVISLNNGRKYISFMNLIGHCNAIINYSTYKRGELMDIMDKYIDNNNDKYDFKDVIEKAFNQILN